MDIRRKLGLEGTEEVNYADVVSGGEVFTKLDNLSGGRDARFGPEVMVFKRNDCNYPIRRVADDITGVAYRSGPKGWTDYRVM